MIEPRLRGKVIVITGATGIAAASAKCCVQHGAVVVVMSIKADDCRALQATLPNGSMTWIEADVSNEASCQEAFSVVAQRHERIDGLCAIAGGSGRPLGDGPLHTITLDAWNATLALNLTTGFLPAREATRMMMATDTPGSIVVTASNVAIRPTPGYFDIHAYAAAKAGMIGWARAAAGAYADRGIRFNVLAPGLTNTPMAARAAHDEATMTWAKSNQPLARGMMEAVDQANAAIYLLSEEARYVTGQVLSVDAGWSVS
jgi:NAD(P)-dependent dehydrogenase (short-subunit alcohol dehydrogenase family)